MTCAVKQQRGAVNMGKKKVDVWAGRSTGMICECCMWFKEKGDKGLGRCRRRAPTMNGYPAVFTNDWCGDHKMDEA